MNYLFLLLAIMILSLKPFAATDNDNSSINIRDRDPNSMTADQQSDNTSDIDITRYIRKSLMKEDELSTYAQNVKIITVNGMVTLKGPVRSEAEQLIILNSANIIAGALNVTNQMTVVPDND